MDEIYAAHGVRFRYPSEWGLSEQNADDEISITVSSPETSYWSLTLFFDRPAVESVLETAVLAFRDEYPELDEYAVDAHICHRDVPGRDIEFVCLELINSAFLRAFRTERFTALVLYQGTDHELEQMRDVLEEISRSLETDFNDEFGAL